MHILIQINQFLWSGPALILLLGVHIYYSCRLHFIQRHLGRGLRLSVGEAPDAGTSGENSKKAGGFSRFGTLATTLAATLGTGNIVGVSTAVSLGGPGAVFWCWLTGILGMATTYAESYLCTRYRHTENGQVRGGPMYILKYSLQKPFLARLYAAALCLSAFCIGCTTQSNAITDACRQVFGLPPVVPAIAAAFMVGFILLQGRKWIEKFSIAIVPTMAIYFFGGCLLYLILHKSFILPAIRQIIVSAFGPSQFAGGVAGFTAGQAVRYGVARGLFTNEAGLGTAGLVAGSTAETQARNQGLISMTATFWDTVVLCAVTGLVIVAFLLEYPLEFSSLSAGSLTAAAFARLPFFGDEILALAILCFALATLVGWSYFGRQGFDFLFHGRGAFFYLAIYLLLIFIGGMMPLHMVWELTDLINLFLMLPAVYMLIKCRKNIH